MADLNETSAFAFACKTLKIALGLLEIWRLLFSKHRVEDTSPSTYP